jgi:hypothetical protein
MAKPGFILMAIIAMAVMAASCGRQSELFSAAAPTEQAQG